MTAATSRAPVAHHTRSTEVRVGFLHGGGQTSLVDAFKRNGEFAQG